MVELGRGLVSKDVVQSSWVGYRYRCLACKRFEDVVRAMAHDKQNEYV